MTQTMTPQIIERLVANHREFLAFLEGKVGSRALAEDILQDAFVRGLAKVEDLREGEAAVGWFYRILRNAVIDHVRHRASVHRRLEAFAAELDAAVPNAEAVNQVCACVTRLAATLKPEYAEVLEQVEVFGMSVKDFAAREGISSSNAAVRVFRARAALRAQVARSCGTCADHGCLDCSCGKKKAELPQPT